MFMVLGESKTIPPHDDFVTNGRRMQWKRAR